MLIELLQFSDSYCLHVVSFFHSFNLFVSFSCRWHIGGHCFFKSDLAICLFNGVFFNPFLFNAIFEIVGFASPIYFSFSLYVVSLLFLCSFFITFRIFVLPFKMFDF